MRQLLLGIPVDLLTKSEVTKKIESFRRSWGNIIVTLNPEILMEARKNERLKSVIQRAQLIVPDGTGIVLAQRFLGLGSGSRVTGIDLFEQLVRHSAEYGDRIFLYGGQPGDAKKTEQSLKLKYPNANIVGADTEILEDGSRLPMETMLERIKADEPTVIFAALGAPKQELWLDQNLKNLPSVRFGVGIGGAFDVFAGKIKRAPKWLRRVGLEWVWRLICQPWRIRRILTATVRFSFAVIRAKVRT